MVQVNEQEWDDMRKGKARLEEMTQFDRDICRADQAKHLVIPLCDIYNLRRIAGILNGLAADFDVLSRRKDMRARTIVLETRSVIDDANRRIREMTGKGKGRKPVDER